MICIVNIIGWPRLLKLFCSVTPFFEKRFLCDHMMGSLHVNDVETINVQLLTLVDLETNFGTGALSKINLIIKR